MDIFSRKEKEILPFPITRMNLAGVMLSEIRRSPHTPFCTSSLICVVTGAGRGAGGGWEVPVREHTLQSRRTSKFRELRHRQCFPDLVLAVERVSPHRQQPFSASPLFSFILLKWSISMLNLLILMLLSWNKSNFVMYKKKKKEKKEEKRNHT